MAQGHYNNIPAFALQIAGLSGIGQALGMIDKDPEGFLPKRMHVQEHLRKITDRRTKATLEIKAFDTTVLTGVKPTGVLAATTNVPSPLPVRTLMLALS